MKNLLLIPLLLITMLSFGQNSPGLSGLPQHTDSTLTNWDTWKEDFHKVYDDSIVKIGTLYFNETIDMYFFNDTLTFYQVRFDEVCDTSQYNALYGKGTVDEDNIIYWRSNKTDTIAFHEIGSKMITVTIEPKPQHHDGQVASKNNRP